jgi:hypothetical protein
MDTPPETTEEQQIASAREAAQKAHPGVEVWTGQHPKTKDWWLYRPATRAEARVYRKKLAEETGRGEMGDVERAYEVLAYACVLYPDRDGLTALLDRRPMLFSVIVGDICEVSGFTNEATQKKA